MDTNIYFLISVYYSLNLLLFLSLLKFFIFNLGWIFALFFDVKNENGNDI